MVAFASTFLLQTKILKNAIFCLQLTFLLLKPTQAGPVLCPSAHPTIEGYFMLKYKHNFLLISYTTCFLRHTDRNVIRHF